MILAVIWQFLLWVASVTLSWNASSGPDVAGYRIKWGFEQGGPYFNVVEAGWALILTIDEPWPMGSIVYFTAYAYNSIGLESGPSNEVQFAVPIPTPEPSPTPEPMPTPTPTPMPTPTPTPEPTPADDGPGLHKGWFK